MKNWLLGKIEARQNQYNTRKKLTRSPDFASNRIDRRVPTTNQLWD
ncbi:hypothetical protein [Nostoc sp. UHCC 0251]|nr:hypothetical protein [Nostoc sp. UHCC 0251]MEA5624589.1 hypothetical protein [Nostoc sp. UHCC 0251]